MIFVQDPVPIGYRFGISAGLQCAIYCAVSSCYSAVKQISRWDQSDLDYILETGNNLYCANGYSRYLALDEIPSICNLGGFTFNLIRIHDMITAEMKIEDDDASFLGPNFFYLLANSRSVLCVVSDVMFMMSKKIIRYYVFDSHSRSACNGMPCGDGTSVLLRFKSYIDLMNCMKAVYLVSHDRQSVFVQLQSFDCDIDETILLNMKKVLRQNRKHRSDKRLYSTASSVKKAKYQENKEQIRENYDCESRRAKYQENKEQIREKYDSESRRAKYEENKDQNTNTLTQKSQENK